MSEELLDEASAGLCSEDEDDQAVLEFNQKRGKFVLTKKQTNATSSSKINIYLKRKYEENSTRLSWRTWPTSSVIVN